MKKLFLLALVDAVLVISGYVIWAFVLNHSNDGILSIMIVSVGIVTLFGLIIVGNEKDVKLEIGFREALASSTFLVYLIILALSVFAGPPGKMSEYPKTMLANFNTIVGIIFAFYFGSLAIEKFAARSKPKDDA